MGRRKITAPAKTAKKAAAPAKRRVRRPSGGVHIAPDLLSRIAERRDTMSKGERRLADVVVADIEFAAHSNTAALAAAAKVSLPTVSRFCRAVGCSGIGDFKLTLAKTLAVGRRFIAQNGRRRDLGKTAADMLESIHKAIDTLAGQLNMSDMRRASAIFASAGRVFVFGGGGGGSAIAQDAEYRLFRLGLAVVCCNDSQLQQMMAATLKKEDALLAVSTGGVYPELVKAAEIARQYGAQIITLTAPGSPLASSATLPLAVHIPEGDNILAPTASRYALLAAIDILALLTAVQLGEPARENLRRIKHQLVALRDGDNRQPLGD